MFNESFEDLIPFLFPGAYLVALAFLHVFANVRPSYALLRERAVLYRSESHASPGSVAGRRHGDDAKPWELIAEQRRPWRASQSEILAGWRALHERQAASADDVGWDQAIIELETRLCELPSDACSEALAAQVKQLLEESPKSVAEGSAELERARALLQRLRAVVFDARDTAYDDAAMVYRKALWLTAVGAVAVAALGAAVQQGEIFFLVGAVGGLLSRLNRVLHRRPQAHDYGASWSTLILAPIAGALAGWFGVLLTEALATGFGVLDKETFDGLFSDSDSLEGGRAALALAIAFVFGFSERLINRAVAAAEDRVVPKLPEGDEAAKQAKNA